MYRQSNSRSKINRSRRGVFSAAAKSTLGQQSAVSRSTSRIPKRQSYSAESAKAATKTDSTLPTRGRTLQKRQSCSAGSSRSGSARGKPPNYGYADTRKQQQKQALYSSNRTGNSVSNLFNDSLDDDLYMSFHSNRGKSGKRSSTNLFNAQKQSMSRQSNSHGRSTSQLFPKDASRTPASGIYDIFDDESMFLSCSSVDFSDSAEGTIKDFDSEAVANLVREFVSVVDESAPKAINIARKIRELSDYNLFSDQIIDGRKSSSNLISSRQTSNASILSTRPW